jgi:hypothetical protein
VADGKGHSGAGDGTSTTGRGGGGVEFEPCDGSTLTQDELATIRALELQFAGTGTGTGAGDGAEADDDDGHHHRGRLAWRSRLGLALWALGGALAVASVWGAAPLTILAAVVALAGFGFLVSEL